MADMCKITKQLFSLRSSTRILLPGLKGKLRKSLLSTEAANFQTELPIYRKPWRVFVAVLLERKPVITKTITDIEKRFEEFQEILELEHSSFSDYEFTKNKVKKNSQPSKKKLTEAEEQKRIENEREFARLEDEEQAIKEEVSGLQFPDWLTPEDHANDLKSLNRKLDKSLHLIVKSNSDDKWLLPEVEIVEGENLKQAAERILKNQYKEDVTALFLSNAPAGVLTEEIGSKDKINSDNQGRKVFFYKAILQREKDGFPSADADLKWLTREEMQKTIPLEYFRQIAKFT